MDHNQDLCDLMCCGIELLVVDICAVVFDVRLMHFLKKFFVAWVFSRNPKAFKCLFVACFDVMPKTAANSLKT